MTRASETERANVGDYPEYLTVDDVADLLRIGRHAVYDAVKRGQIPGVKIGRALRIPRERLREVMEGRNEEETNASGQ